METIFTQGGQICPASLKGPDNSHINAWSCKRSRKFGKSHVKTIEDTPKSWSNDETRVKEGSDDGEHDDHEEGPDRKGDGCAGGPVIM